MWWDKFDPGAKPKPPGKPFDFMKIRWVGFAFTLAMIVITTASLATRGLNLGLDFTGGVLIEAGKPDGFDVAKIRSGLAAAGIDDASVQLADQGREAIIRLAPDTKVETVDEVTRRAIATLGEGVEIRKTDSVGPKVSGELFLGGVIASLLSVVAIAIYVWFRFESRFGMAAFLTTFHDVYAVVGMFSVTQIPFDLTTVAAVLTVAGYSINDTVVVFDRIREMLRKFKRQPLPDTIDIAITSTLTRTLITSVATLLASLSMLFLGGPVLFGFAAAIVFGILIGTYSSIFVASPMLMFLPGKMPGAPNPEDGQPAQDGAAQGA